MVKYASHTNATFCNDNLEEIAIISVSNTNILKDNAFSCANGPSILHGCKDSSKIINNGLQTLFNKNSPPTCIKKKTQSFKNSKSNSQRNLINVFGEKLRINSKKMHSNNLSASKILHNVDNYRQITNPMRKGALEDVNTGTTKAKGNNADKLHTNKWTFVFDPSGRISYYWSMILSFAFLYNFWVLIYRFAFQETNTNSIAIWFSLDYLMDMIYIIDIAFHFRVGYLEDGVLQTNASKLRHHYMNSMTFYIDCLCLLPLDFLYLSIGFNSLLRCFRLIKVYRFWLFLDQTERRTNYPNLFRSISLLHNLLAIFHWNTCMVHIIAKNHGLENHDWGYPKFVENEEVSLQYLRSYYWCILLFMPVGDIPKPKTKGEYAFVIIELQIGIILFSCVLGFVANIIASVNMAKKEFQAKLDGVKSYMRLRKVPNHLQNKVVKWFDYLWILQKSADEDKVISYLPDKLKAEIAIHIHLDTLRKVEIFQNTEAGFLCELVLKLRPILFSPGDYICRKGEIGKEMYIVNRGKLQVVTDDGKLILATLKSGSYFGEISILNLEAEGNRRTASVRSVGYSDLFVLSKKDLWDVLKDYPTARIRLEAIAIKRLETYKKIPKGKVQMIRTSSAPGLVESKQKVPLETMQLQKVEIGVANSNQSLQISNNKFDRLIYVDSVSPTLSSSHLGASLDSSRSIFDANFEKRNVLNSLPRSNVYLNGERFNCEENIRQEVLISEIKRLREKLTILEYENSNLSMKLSQQQWDVENRLADIEMRIAGVSSNDESSGIDEEKNRESFI